jgi:3-hydroxyisobutyrate dehydrogenase-like beta-hydroxyacid dehydrogenase
MDKNSKIAFLGLGTMGAPMARRVLAAGYPLTVWNRSPERAAVLAGEGARVAETPAEAVREADVVVTMLADPLAVQGVVARFASALRPGACLIEASTIGAQALAELSGLLPEGVTLVDAPVMGSADRAAAGELSLLVGGDADEVMPVATAAAELPLSQAVYERVTAYPEASEEDLGQIVRYVRG